MCLQHAVGPSQSSGSRPAGRSEHCAQLELPFSRRFVCALVDLARAMQPPGTCCSVTSAPTNGKNALPDLPLHWRPPLPIWCPMNPTE